MKGKKGFLLGGKKKSRSARNLKRDKRGFLLGEETLKIIIAVICIGFLVYFLAALYFSQQDEKKQAQAHAVLTNSSESLDAIIDRMNAGNISSEDKLIHTPAGWNLMGFFEGDKIPNSCFGKSCLCICNKLYVDTFFGLIDSRQLKECDEKGACLVVENLANEEINFEINENTQLNLKKENGLIYVRKTNDS